MLNKNKLNKKLTFDSFKNKTKIKKLTKGMSE